MPNALEDYARPHPLLITCYLNRDQRCPAIEKTGQLWTAGLFPDVGKPPKELVKITLLCVIELFCDDSATIILGFFLLPLLSSFLAHFVDI